MSLDNLLAKNIIPDPLIRYGIRNLLKARLREESRPNSEAEQERFMELVRQLKASPLAVNTADANEQHYEVPAAFYEAALGKNLKYSCGYWENAATLDESEDAMLALTCERAGLKNGEDVLELGCGWGSLTLFMAARYPHSRITAVSNSSSQKQFIDNKAQERNLKNITVITADMNDFTTGERFDRIVSVEMFEHMRNYEVLFGKVHSFLKPGGELFIHIFTHHKYAYLFEVRDETDWMTKYFFSGGIMPSNHLMLYFANGFEVMNHWVVNGTHYEKTANAWLARMDENKETVLPLFENIYGKTEALRWWVNWRVFFMSCAELWGFRNGNEWYVSHYRFKRK